MRKSVWFFIVLAAVVSVYSGVWFATATYVREHAALWLEGRRHDGLTITYGAPALAGFPFKAEVRFADFAVAAPGMEGSPGWSWRTGTLRIFARPFVFDTFFLDLSGAHTLTGVSAGDLPLQADTAEAAFKLGRDGVENLRARIVGVTTLGNQASAALGKATMDITTTATGLHVEIAAEQATLPDVLPAPLSRTLQSLKLSLDVAGTLATGAPLPEILEAWRDGGGTLEVRDLAVDWPPVTATGSGTLALDRAMQPEGAFSATFRGFLEVVDMLVAAGRMEPREASLARGALVLLATTPVEGAPPELKLALTVQDRKVYAGPVTLMEMPVLVWRKNVIIP